MGWQACKGPQQLLKPGEAINSEVEIVAQSSARRGQSSTRSPHSRTTVFPITHCLFPLSWKLGLHLLTTPRFHPPPPTSVSSDVGAVSKQAHLGVGAGILEGKAWTWACFVLSLPPASRGCQGQAYNPSIRVRPPRGSPPRRGRPAGQGSPSPTCSIGCCPPLKRS